MNLKVTILVFCLFCVSFSVFAQSQYGAIQGTVQDTDGQAIPSVSINVSSPSLIGETRVAVTDQHGFYRFPFLAPGTYELKTELSGFQTTNRKGITLFIGNTLTADFTLELLQVSEAIEVTGRPPLIDSTTTAVATIVPPEIVSTQPKRNDIRSLVALTPGVSDDLVAFGASDDKADENAYWIDGTNLSDPRAGSLILQYDQNWIEQVQVTGIGAPAEYGGFTGVLANFTTRSGSNQFHGLVETFFQNENLASSHTEDPAGETPFSTYDFSAQLGGPLLRDKLWFFSGFEYPHTETHPFGYDGVTTDVQTKFISKLTYQHDDNNTLQGFVHFNHHTIEGLDADYFVLPEATRTNKNPQFSWNTTWISLLNSATNLEARFGGFNHHSKDIEDRPDLSGHCDVAIGICSVNSAIREESKLNRLQGSFALTHYSENFIQGGHDFRFGVQFQHSSGLREQHYNGGVFYAYDYAGMPYYRKSFEYSFPVDGDQISSFAQDDWRITDRFSASVGVRWDHNRGSTDLGKVYANDQVAPRLGFVWKLNQKNETVLKAHYGHYFEALLQRSYSGVTDGRLPIIGEIYDQGEWVEVFRQTFKTHIPGDLKQPYVQQFNVGVDHVLPGEVPIGVHYIYRRWYNILLNQNLSEFDPVSFINPITGEPITVYLVKDPDAGHVVTNPPGLYRRYHGVEIFASKQFSSGFSFTGSLVYSDLEGNAQSVNDGTRFGLDPNSYLYPGNLIVDRPLSCKIAGTYPLPWGFNAGWYFRHESGNTWTPLIRVPGVPFGLISGEPQGSRRLPSKNLMDLRFEKEFPISQGQLRFTIDVFNLFNTAYVTRVNRVFEDPGFGAASLYNEPRQIRLGVRYTF